MFGEPTDDNVVGTVYPNTSAAKAGLAQGDEIVVGPTTAERIRNHFVLESLGDRTFKNVSQPIRVYRVIPPGVYEKIV